MPFVYIIVILLELLSCGLIDHYTEKSSYQYKNSPYIDKAKTVMTHY